MALMDHKLKGVQAVLVALGNNEVLSARLPDHALSPHAAVSLMLSGVGHWHRSSPAICPFERRIVYGSSTLLTLCPCNDVRGFVIVAALYKWPLSSLPF